MVEHDSIVCPKCMSGSWVYCGKKVTLDGRHRNVYECSQGHAFVVNQKYSYIMEEVEYYDHTDGESDIGVWC
jgi:hypothetical protein